MNLFPSAFNLAAVSVAAVMLVLCVVVDGSGLRKGTKWSVALLWASMMIYAVLRMLPEAEAFQAARTPARDHMFVFLNDLLPGVMLGAYLVLLLTGDFMAFLKAVNIFFGRAEKQQRSSEQ